MATRLDEEANEGCTYAVAVSFFDEDGTAVIPTAATWTLSHTDSTDVNSRTDVPITPLDTTYDIVLLEDDVVCRTSGVDDVLVLTVKYTYTSSLGVGLKCVDEREIFVNNMVNS